MRFYDDNGNVTDEFLMAPLLNSLNDLNSSTLTVPMVQIEAGQWHSLEVLEDVYPMMGVYPELVEGRRRVGGMSRWQKRI